jgi:hypothetical protein
MFYIFPAKPTYELLGMVLFGLGVNTDESLLCDGGGLVGVKYERAGVPT